MNVYNTVITYWLSETEAITIPVLSVSASPEAARENAVQVLSLMALESPEILRSARVTIAPALVPEAVMRAFLERLRAERPDLAQHATPPRTKRGRPSTTRED